MIYHAWYSKEAELSYNRNGEEASIYKTLDGVEVRVTEVSENETTTSMWSDQKYLGLVNEFLRYADPIIGPLEFRINKAEKEEHERILRRYQ